MKTYTRKVHVLATVIFEEEQFFTLEDDQVLEDIIEEDLLWDYNTNNVVGPIIEILKVKEESTVVDFKEVKETND